MNARTVSQVVLGVVTLAICGAAIAGSIWGLPTFLIGLAAGALCLVIVLMWASLQQMEEEGEMEFEQALSYAAPSAEEEQKRALLRTLKDLEYELSVGKISREDYDLVSAEVREKAKRMIALTDEVMKEKLEAAERRVTVHLSDTEQVEEAPKKKAARSSKKKRKQQVKKDSTEEGSPGTETSADDPPSSHQAKVDEKGEAKADDPESTGEDNEPSEGEPSKEEVRS